MRKLKTFSIPPSSSEAVEDYMAESDPVRLFLEEELCESVTQTRPTIDFYGRYKEWAADRGFKQKAINSFGKHLAALGTRYVRKHNKTFWYLDFKSPKTFSQVENAK